MPDTTLPPRSTCPQRGPDLSEQAQDRTLIIACGSLAREIGSVIGRNGLSHLSLRCLPATLHNTPEKIPEAVRDSTHYRTLFLAALVLFVGFVLGWGISMDVPSEKMPVGAAVSLPAQEPCLWIAQRDQNISSEQQKSTRSTKASAHSVVLSCVACHLQSSAD